MAKIKICGIRRLEDVNYLNMLKPDYAGFIFAKSKRQVTLEGAKELIGSLDKDIKTVGVFLNEDIEKVRYIAEYLKLNVLQFHGGESREYIERFSEFTVWKTVSIDVSAHNIEDLSKINEYKIDGILLDSSVKGVQGGTGVSFNWDIIEKININKSIILAGGLNPENIQQAVKIVNPYAVDVSSGVEIDGIKNFDKIKEFTEKVRKII